MPAPANIDLSSLDGSTGFKLSGEGAGNQSGGSVASAGDVNGDGFADLIVGARNAGPPGSTFGASYVVFGKASGFAANLDLSSLDGSTGFRLTGAAAFDSSGNSVASAGDVNGDGFADLIVGAPGADPHGSSSGVSYVVFGKASGFAANLDLSSLDGSTGFKLSGVAPDDRSGGSVASAGDVNGDGFADLIVGAEYADSPDTSSGASYLVFGKASGFAANLDLSSLDGSTGFKLSGGAAGDRSGISVASAGDVNGDGFADLVVGAPYADAPGNYSGASYVMFGKASGFGANLDLSSLDGSTGFRLSGATAYDRSGWSVASAGDVNGDGFADLIVGAKNADPQVGATGASYVVFGRASGFGANLDLSSLDGSTGFRLSGGAAYDQSGWSVASAGDVNGDGFADLIVGAFTADPHGDASGASYVVFGRASGFGANLDLSSLDGSTGFSLSGEAANDFSGWSVASAGDVNGDGFADLIVGAPWSDPHGSVSGGSYVVFGGAFGATVTTTGTAAAEMLIGGVGDDTLSGGGGADVFHAGAGDDRITVADLTFRLADGGGGTDTLALGGAGLSLDLTSVAVAVKLDGIERIDLTGTGNNTLAIDELAVRDGVGAVTGGKHVLAVEGEAGDTVLLGDERWRKSGSFTDASGTFDRWTLDNAEIDIEQGIAVPGVTIEGTGGDDNISPASTVPGQPFATFRGDVINGNGGNDRLNGSAGADVMAGGTGDDIYYVDDAADEVVELGGEGSDIVFSTVDYILAADQEIESLRVSSSAGLTLTGNGSDNYLVGGDGADTLNGEGGNDRINGGIGGDAMSGGTGNDLYYVDNAADQVFEESGEGSDTIYATAGYTLAADQEIEFLRVSGSAGLTLTGNGCDNSLFGRDGADILNGGGGDDQLNGGAGADTLDGGSGNDRLNGGTGGDAMSGGAGDDVYFVDNAADRVIEATGGGSDTVYASGDFALEAEQEVETLRVSGSAGLTLTGNELANYLIGGVGVDHLDGGAGNDRLKGDVGADVMTGGAGDDVYYVDNAADRVIEATGGGSDTVYTSVDYRLETEQEVELLRVSGAAGLALTGNEFEDTLIGGAGNDRLNGAAGDDTLIGGGGADTFAFTSPSGGVDRIADFASGVDRLEFSAAGFGGGLVAGFPAPGRECSECGIGVGRAGNGYFIFDNAGASRGALYWDVNGGSGADAVMVATLTGATSLSASDLVIV